MVFGDEFMVLVDAVEIFWKLLLAILYVKNCWAATAAAELRTAASCCCWTAAAICCCCWCVSSCWCCDCWSTADGHQTEDAAAAAAATEELSSRGPQAPRWCSDISCLWTRLSPGLLYIHYSVITEYVCGGKKYGPAMQYSSYINCVLRGKTNLGPRSRRPPRQREVALLNHAPSRSAREKQDSRGVFSITKNGRRVHERIYMYTHRYIPTMHTRTHTCI